MLLMICFICFVLLFQAESDKEGDFHEVKVQQKDIRGSISENSSTSLLLSESTTGKQIHHNTHGNQHPSGPNSQSHPTGSSASHQHHHQRVNSVGSKHQNGGSNGKKELSINHGISSNSSNSSVIANNSANSIKPTTNGTTTGSNTSSISNSNASMSSSSTHNSTNIQSNSPPPIPMKKEQIVWCLLSLSGPIDR